MGKTLAQRASPSSLTFSITFHNIFACPAKMVVAMFEEIKILSTAQGVPLGGVLPPGGYNPSSYFLGSAGGVGKI